ncbi:MAG: hypothetical protein ABI621_02865 [Chloroflexota bacterium]
MMQDRKYFGMTIKQVGILAGLAVVACLLFGVTSFFALRRSFLPQSPQNTPVMQSTPAPFVLPTLVPTVTLTPVPYEQLIPNGWQQHQTTLVELWLPSGFDNTGSPAGAVVSGNSVVVELSLAGTSPSTSADTIYASVAYEPLTADSLDAFLEERLATIPPEVNMSERRKVLINSTEAYRLMFEWQNSSVYTNDLLFIFLDGSTIWYVKYSAEIKDFYELLPVFDDSVKTFRVVR